MGFERKRKAYLALAGRTFVLLVLIGSGTRALNPQAKGLRQCQAVSALLKCMQASVIHPGLKQCNYNRPSLARRQNKKLVIYTSELSFPSWGWQRRGVLIFSHQSLYQVSMGVLYFKVLPKEVTIIFIYLLLLFYIFKEVLEKLPKYFDIKDNCYFSFLSFSLSFSNLYGGGRELF